MGVRLPLLPLRSRGIACDAARRASRLCRRARPAAPSWQGSALLPRRRLERRSQVRVLLPPLVRCGRAVRRATVNREAQVRSLPSELVARPRGRTGYDAGLSIRKLRVRVPPGVLVHWTADGRSKGVTEQRLTLKRCVGRNVHPASLRGECISLAVHDGGWQACRRATDGYGKRSQRAAPYEGSKALLPPHRLIICL